MPEWRDEIRRRLDPLQLSPTREAEIVEELAQHCEDRYRELCAGGSSEAEAHAGALREIDDVEMLRREVARVERPSPLQLPPPGAETRGGWARGFVQDTRYAFRMLRRSPGFTFTVLAAFALSIGPITAIASIGNLLIWRPPPGISEPDRLAVVWFGRWSSDTGVNPTWITYQNLHDAIGRAKLASGIVGVQETGVSLAAPGSSPRVIEMSHSTANLFQVLGVPLAAGRRFLPEEDGLGGAPVVIISHRLARSVFGDPQSAIEKPVFLNSRAFTVIGVTAPGFQGIAPMGGVDVWITGGTLSYTQHAIGAPRPARFYSFVVRLAPRATFDGLEAELNGLVRYLEQQSDENAGRFRTVGARVFPGLGVDPLARPYTSNMVRTMLFIGAVLLVLGCANVANLLLFRTTRRQEETAVRKALGASRTRLVQVQVVESCLLALGGASLGLGLAFILKQLIHGLLYPRPAGTTFDVPVDGRVLAVTIAAAVVSGLVASVAPAWIAAMRADGGTVGRSNSRTSARAPRLRGALAALQLALSFALLIGALLMISTLRNLRSVDLGFDPVDVTAMSMALNSHGYSRDRALGFHRTVLSLLERRGEFEGASLAAAPIWPSMVERVVPPDGDQTTPLHVSSNAVSHDYFQVMGIPLVQGRSFTPQESFTPGADVPVIVNEALARRLFGTRDVLGRTLRFAATAMHPTLDLPIVGVVGDTRSDPAEEPQPYVYRPLGSYDLLVMSMTFIVRSGLAPVQVQRIVTEITSGVDSRVPLNFARPLSLDLDRSLSQQRMYAWLFGLLAGLAFVLASLGLYGLVAQTTTERRREFGIRLAIGAGARDIVRLVARYALLISAVGVAAGLALAWLSTRMISAMLFGVSRLDTTVYVAATLMLAAVVVIACIPSTLRAIRVQPVDVLRAE